MAVSKQEVILEFNADTSDVTKSLGQVEQGIEGTSKATEGLTNQLDKMTGGAVSGLGKLGGGLKTAATGFQTLRGAVAATGIGALLIAITSLVAYFKRTERGAQQLRKITATLGAVMDKLVDVVIKLGEGIFNAFTNPKKALTDFAQALKENIINRFEGLLELVPKLGEAVGLLFEGKFGQAAKTATDAVGKVTTGIESVTDAAASAAEAAGDFADEIARTAQAAADLTDRQNKLKVAEREFLSVRAQTNKTIAENRLLVEDETLAFEDRIGALDEAIAAEERTIAKELEFARERAAILEEQAALAESDEETKQAVAEAQAAVIELETRSLRTQKRLEGERQSLILQRDARAKQEQAAAQKAAEEAEKTAEAELAARQKLEDELFALTLTAQEREELAAQQKFDERVAIAGDDEGLIQAATERLNADLAAIDEKYRKQGEDADKKETDDALAELQRYYDEAEAIVNAGEQQDRESELLQTQARFAEQIALAQKLGEDTTVLVEAQRQAELEINKKYDAQELARAEELAEQEKQIEQTKRDVRDQTINALLELNNAFAGDTEEQQKKAFERSKKIQSAQALISTYESAVQAFKSLAGIPVVGPALGTAASVAAIASGLAQVKSIQSQTFGGGATAPPPPTPAPALSAAATEATQAPSAPTLDLSFLGDIATTPQPQQAYVISENVTTAQQANKKIQDQAAL